MAKRFSDEVVKGTGPEFILAKLAERDERHRRQGTSRYLVEPNVKEGKGGLRDLHTLFWIAKYFYETSDTDDLVKRGVSPRRRWTGSTNARTSSGGALQPALPQPQARRPLGFEWQREIAALLGYQGIPACRRSSAS